VDPSAAAKECLSGLAELARECNTSPQIARLTATLGMTTGIATQQAPTPDLEGRCRDALRAVLDRAEDVCRAALAAGDVDSPAQLLGFLHTRVGIPKEHVLTNLMREVEGLYGPLPSDTPAHEALLTTVD